MKFSTKVTLQIGPQMMKDVPLIDALALAECILRTVFVSDDLSKRRSWEVPVNVFESK